MDLITNKGDILKIVLVLLAMGSCYNISEEETCSICICNQFVMNCTNLSLQTLPRFKNTHIKITELILDENYLTHITVLPKLGIASLSLANNHIVRIDDSSFCNLQKLTMLDLSSNYLTSDKLMPNIFRGNYAPDAYEPLWSLKILILDNNRLHVLHPDIFEHLPNLETLSLSKNPLKVLDYGINKALSSVPQLKELNLSNTMLTKLPENFLYAPKYLEKLDLSNNNLKDVPMELESTHAIKWLSLNNNPIFYVRTFPKLTFLRTLHLSYMKSLIKIGSRSLSMLPMLEEFHCNFNNKLTEIDSQAFSSIHDNEEGETWPPLQMLLLNDNKLRYLESHLVGRWDKLIEIDLQNNPWICDCEGQWMISTLIPLIKKTTPDSLFSVQCKEPIEMSGILLSELEDRHYHMRCLDYYNNKPEKDGKVLVCIFVGVLISIPFVMAITLYWNNNSYFYRRSLFTRLDEMDL